MDEKIIHKEVDIEDCREHCKVLCERETTLTKELEENEDKLEKERAISNLEDERLQMERTILEEELRRIESLEARMRTAVLDGGKVAVLPSDDDTPLFEFGIKQLAVDNDIEASWGYDQHFKPGFILRHHNALVDLFEESDQYCQLKEEIQEDHYQLAAKIGKKNTVLAALQSYYNSKFKGKLFFLRRKKEMKKMLKVSLIELRQEVTILEAALKASETICSNNKTFDIDLEF